LSSNELYYSIFSESYSLCYYSLFQVETTGTTDLDRAAEFHKLIIETVGMLISAGCEHDITETAHRTNLALLTLIESSFWPDTTELLIFKRASAHRNLFRLRSELIGMLINKDTLRLLTVYILQGAVDIVKIREMITHIPGAMDPYEEMLDSL